MYQEPEIKELPPKQLAGIHVRMSLSENRSFQLWSTFMPRRREISNRVGDELFSLQVYEMPEYFRQFNPEAQFEKWAAVEVTSAEDLPAGIEPFRLEGGRYAVFIYRGLPEATGPFFQWLFSSWLPASGYMLDDRPHFEILGSKYKHGDPASEEEVWIPIYVL